MIANLAEWRSHLLDRLRQQIGLTADPMLTQLMGELLEYPEPDGGGWHREPKRDYGGVVVPLELVTEHGLLSLFSTTTVFGTPVEVTLSELALESFFPADAATAGILRQMGEARRLSS